ncbi:tetratricopeptide repeat protein [Polyangium sp. 6x1]|uniref:tetratricopeptide repeat protein n=1 Tax=Polyangium sp. 6x1 TaxID=3042689 RepID=UPI002482238E|nr:tetratricopeptide repeat protein [Polyangium sp. 6x1]MDI1444530.1 tetratricopeptide repeat protein [Polyangium sp. 6x1]
MMASTRRSFSVAPMLLTMCFAAGPLGCGSTTENCRPAISGDVAAEAPRVDAGVSGTAGARVDAAANANVEPPRTEAQLREAAELRARAKVNIDAGRLREALPDLERAFELSGDVTILGDLGLALQAAGRLDEAWLALHRFRAEARAAYEPIRAKIDGALGELSGKLGGLVVEGGVPGALVLVRGQLAARLPMASPIYLAPGDVSVVVRAPGKPDLTVRARVAVGAVARASANLDTPGIGVAAGGLTGTVGGLAGGLTGGLGKPTGGLTGAVGGLTAPVGGLTGAVGGLAAPNPGIEAPNPGLSAPNIGAPNLSAPVGAATAPVGAIAAPVAAATAPVWPIVVGVGGLAVMGGAIAASVVHSGRLDNFDANLCGGSGASPECPSIESGIKVTTGLQVVGYILGTAALTTGIVVFAVTRSAPDLECPKVGRAPAVTLQCGPHVGGKGGGVGCVGTF